MELFELVIRSKACRNAVKFNNELENGFIKNILFKALIEDIIILLIFQLVLYKPKLNSEIDLLSI